MGELQLVDQGECWCLSGLMSKLFPGVRSCPLPAAPESIRLFVWTEDQKHRPVWTACARRRRGAPTVELLQRPLTHARFADVFCRLQGMGTTEEELKCYLLPDGGLVDDLCALRDGDSVLLRGGPSGHGTCQGFRQVTVQTKILGLSRIDTVAQTFHADFVVVLTWIESCLVAISEDKVDWDLVFHPFLDIRNAFELEELTHFGDQGLTKLNSENGQVTAVLRFKGVLSQPMDLEAFPFDTQDLVICIGTRGQNTTEVTLHPHVGSVVLPPETHASLPDWKLQCVDQKGVFTDPKHALHQSVYSLVQVRVQVTRLPTFYMTNIVAVLFGIVSLSFLSYLLSPDALADRLDINCTLLLAAIGFKAYVAEALPKISLFTAIDCYIFGLYSFLYFVVLENAAVCWLAYRWSLEKASMVDRLCLVASLAVFAGLHAWTWSWLQEAQQRSRLTCQGRQAGACSWPSAYTGILPDSPVARAPGRLWRNLSNVSRRFMPGSPSSVLSGQPRLCRATTGSPVRPQRGHLESQPLLRGRGFSGPFTLS